MDYLSMEAIGYRQLSTNAPGKESLIQELCVEFDYPQVKTDCLMK